MKKLNLNAIRIDGGTQPRERIDMVVVGDYTEAVKVGIEFPPVVVFHDGAEHWLADGFHRYHAHKQAEKASIVADVRAGTRRDAWLYALGANFDHGLRLTNEDKRRIVGQMLDDEECAKWSQERIAKHCHVSPGFVSKLVAERRASLHGEEMKPSVRTVERAGKTYQQDTSNIGKAAHEAAAVAGTPAKSAKTTLPPAPAPERGQTLPPDDDTPPENDDGPSAAELAAAEREAAEELEALRRIALADDKMAAVLAENKQLRAEVRVLKERRDGLMNENAELVKRIKALQRKLDRLEHA